MQDNQDIYDAATIKRAAPTGKPLTLPLPQSTSAWAGEPATAETAAYLASVINLLNPTIARLEALLAKAWCFLPGERVLVVRHVGYVNPFGGDSLCSTEVTLVKPVPAPDPTSTAIFWKIAERPNLPVPESALRPLQKP